MASTKAKRAGPAKQHRASWKGQFSFGLVSFPVEAFNALDREHGDIHFHQLHAECHSRVRYQKVCPIHGEVSNDEIVPGYEYKKGKYVEVEPDELEALRTDEDRALKIDAFVSPDSVDPIYFDGRMYYLLPAGSAAQEPFAVIVEALEREGRYGVGKMVMSGKDQIVLIRALEGILHLAMLNYQAEIRPPKKVAAGVIEKRKLVGQQVRMAQKLIEEWNQEDFDFSAYRDTYREKVAQVIDAKIHGREIVTPKTVKPTKVLNLLDALRKSVALRSRTKSSVKKGRHSA